MTLRSLLAVGTGVGIEIRGRDLTVTAVRVRPGGVAVAGHTVIAGFAQRPAAEWGAEYHAFLRRVGAGHVAAAVLLPRSEVIVRTVAFPGVGDKDLATAVPLQVDSLHPFAEDEAAFSWARVPGTGSVLIGVAHRGVIERYGRAFVEAGVRIASFTFSAAVLYSAARLLSVPPAGGFLAVGGGSLPEAYGESSARPVLSAPLVDPVERSIALAAAELRLESGAEPLALDGILPKPRSLPEEFAVDAAALSYAAALASACPRLFLKANLLPVELRSANSRMALVPTAALAALLAALGVALAAQGTWEERRQLGLLQAEIARVEPLARKADAAARAADRARQRARLLDRFKRRTEDTLNALNEITRLVEPPGWVNSLEMDDTTVTISGQAPEAAPLLKQLDGSPLFQNSEFVGQIGKAENAQIFRIRASREGAGQ